MPSILQKLFGRRDAAGDGGGSAAVSLGLFGKHPAWNDFSDDIGLETQRLIEFKRLLFHGIDSNIAQWDHLHEQQRIDAFRHVTVWVLGDGVLAARLWASSDGKGRTRYPMVAAADCSGVPLPAVLRHVLPALEQVRNDVVKAATPEAVYAAADAHRGALRRWAASPAAAAAAVAPADDLTPAAAAARVRDCPAFGEGGRGLLSLLYRLDQEAPQCINWGRDGWGGGATDSKTIAFRPAYVRVPACADAPADAALLWARFLEALLNRRASKLIILPSGERWADLIIGEPTGASLYCLRASEKGVPLTSDIPYTIEPAFGQKAAALLADCAGARRQTA